jgi:hypothetical protein
MRDAPQDIAARSAYFSDDVETARGRFLSACDRIGLRVTSYPARVPAAGEGAGGALYCDVARLGAPEAENLLVLCPAAAGGAGFAGAGVVHGVLAGGLSRDLPRDVACLLVHAINPIGPSWPPHDATIAQAAPGEETPAVPWSDGMLSAADRRFAAYEKAQRFDRDRLAGQTLASLAPPAWDRAVTQAIATTHLGNRRRILFVDVRTGAGPFGEIDYLAPNQPGTGARETAERWLGQPLEGSSASLGQSTAPIAGGLAALAPTQACEKASVLLEAGTYSMATLLQASGPRGSDGIAAYPREARWRAQLWDAASEVIRRGFKGLADGA